MWFPYETHVKTAQGSLGHGSPPRVVPCTAHGLQVGISALSRRLAAGKSKKWWCQAQLKPPDMMDIYIGLWRNMGYLYGFIWVYGYLYLVGGWATYHWLVIYC